MQAGKYRFALTGRGGAAKLRGAQLRAEAFEPCALRGDFRLHAFCLRRSHECGEIDMGGDVGAAGGEEGRVEGVRFHRLQRVAVAVCIAVIDQQRVAAVPGEVLGESSYGRDGGFADFKERRVPPSGSLRRREE